MSAFQSLSSVLFPALFIGGNNFDNYLALFVVLGSAVQLEGLEQRWRLHMAPKKFACRGGIPSVAKAPTENEALTARVNPCP